MKPPPEARWTGYSDGVGHAFLEGRLVTRAVCGASRLPERYAWPITSRCAACTDGLSALIRAALLGAEPVRRAPAITESEHRLFDGNR